MHYTRCCNEAPGRTVLVSILYLRCARMNARKFSGLWRQLCFNSLFEMQKNYCKRQDTQQQESFNSLFEMPDPHRQAQGGAGYCQRFNSLFEMPPARGLGVGRYPLAVRFNSLFEMRSPLSSGLRRPLSLLWFQFSI